VPLRESEPVLLALTPAVRVVVGVAVRVAVRERVRLEEGDTVPVLLGEGVAGGEREGNG
jgi:hypothetical protein